MRKIILLSLVLLMNTAHAQWEVYDDFNDSYFDTSGKWPDSLNVEDEFVEQSGRLFLRLAGDQSYATMSTPALGRYTSGWYAGSRPLKGVRARVAIGSTCIDEDDPNKRFWFQISYRGLSDENNNPRSVQYRLEHEYDGRVSLSAKIQRNDEYSQSAAYTNIELMNIDNDEKEILVNRFINFELDIPDSESIILRADGLTDRSVQMTLPGFNYRLAGVIQSASSPSPSFSILALSSSNPYCAVVLDRVEVKY